MREDNAKRLSYSVHPLSLPPRRDDLGLVRGGGCGHVSDDTHQHLHTRQDFLGLRRTYSYCLQWYRVARRLLTELQHVSTIMSGFIFLIRDKLYLTTKFKEHRWIEEVLKFFLLT